MIQFINQIILKSNFKYSIKKNQIDLTKIFQALDR